MKSIYLDYAAATPVNAQVLAAMEPYFGQQFYNPSATYLAAKSVHAAVEAARSRVAEIVGTRSAEILWTAGGTEANNLALHGIMQQYPGKRIVVSSIEHESVLSLAHSYNAVEAPVHPDGILDVAAFSRLIDDDTVLASIMYANNEIGTVQPLHDIATVIRTILDNRRKAGNTLPLYFHTDATQAANYLDLHVSRLGVDLMTLNGGKIYGPKQTGVLYVRAGVTLLPLVYGGGQEHGMRSGTENVPGVVGFSAALDLVQNGRHEETKRLQGLQQLFFELLEEKIAAAIINGSHRKRLPNNIHMTLPGQDNERLLMALDEAGIMAAAGSACSASNEEPSNVLRAMGISETDAQASLRFTMGRETSESDIRRTVDVLAQLVA